MVGSASGPRSVASSSLGAGRRSDSITTRRSIRPANSSAAMSASRKPYQIDERVPTIVHWKTE